MLYLELLSNSQVHMILEIAIPLKTLWNTLECSEPGWVSCYCSIEWVMDLNRAYTNAKLNVTTIVDSLGTYMCCSS
jgi:hypothetical protein